MLSRKTCSNQCHFILNYVVGSNMIIQNFYIFLCTKVMYSGCFLKRKYFKSHKLTLSIYINLQWTKLFFSQ